jgi:bifunctional non-homologous end joining protein LigD
VGGLVVSTRDLLSRYAAFMHWRNPGPVRRPPSFLDPCLPTISRSVPPGPRWAYEIKHDGFRFLAVHQSKSVGLYSRGGHDWSERLSYIKVGMTRIND